jgi:hypothetical protein
LKKIYSLLLTFISICSFSQQEVNNQWKAQVNPIFAGLNKSRIPHAILNDYAMEFTNVPAYNGTLTDSTFVDANVLGNIYKTLFMGKVTTATTHFPTMQTIATNWTTHRRTYNQTEQSTMVVAGLFYQYSRIKTNALATNKITVTSNKYYDKFISSVWQNPYETLNTVAFTPAINTYNKKSFGIILPSNLLLTNSVSLINKIELNCNDGSGYKIISNYQKVFANYAENGIYNWVFKTTLTNGTVLYSQTKVKIEAPITTGTNPVQKTATTFDNNVVILGPGSGLTAYYNGAILRIDYAPLSNGQIVKPFIVAEGFDAGSITSPEVEGGDRTLFGQGDFLESLQTSGNLRNFLDFDSSQQYDIIYIDWQNGTNDIKENSKVLKSVLAWVNSKKAEAGSTQQNVLMGQSMGGLIGRYTLAKMEQDGVPHDVRLFIAHDSPMQGANTPLSTQYFSRHIYDQYTEAPIIYGAIEYLIPTLLNFTELLTFGAVDIAFPSVNDILTIQDTPAALQLNYHYVDILSNPTMSVHNNWQTEFDAMGYPQLCRNIAISNGNECAVDHGFNAGDKFINLHQSLSPAVFGDISGMLIDFSLGLITTDFNLAILGILPGSSKYTFDFDLHSNPNISASIRKVYYGRIRYEKKFLYILPITHTITERTKNAPSGYLPFDTYTGGFYDIRNVTNSLPITLSNSIFINPRYGFIPVVSALDIKRNNLAVNSSDYMKKYAGGVTPELALTSGFDNFIVDYNNGNPINNEHISFQVRNGNWLAEELQVNPITPVYPNFNCINFCANAAITGSKFLCTTGNYSVTSEATIANWTITDGNSLATLSNETSTTATLTQTSPTSNGYVTLLVTFGNERCGTTNATLTIWVGKPRVTNFSIIGASDNVPTNSSDQFNVNYATEAVSYDWTVSSLSSTCTDSNGFYPPGIVLPKFSNGSASYSSVTPYSTISWGNCSGTYLVNCKAVNTCGFNAYYTRIVNVYGPGGGGGEDPCLPSLQVYPNPVNDDDLVVNLIPPPDPCGGIPSRMSQDGKNILKVYDMLGNLVYTKTYNSLEIRINDLNLKRGHYILNVFTSSGKTNKEIIIVE